MVQEAKNVASIDAVCEHIVGGIKRSGAIDTFFERKKGQTVRYSHRQLTKMETRTEIAKWVCESVRPFKIVKDCGLLVLLNSVAGSGPRTDQGPQSGPGPNPTRTGPGPIPSVQSCSPSPVLTQVAPCRGPVRTGPDRSVTALI